MLILDWDAGGLWSLVHLRMWISHHVLWAGRHNGHWQTVWVWGEMTVLSILGAGIRIVVEER